MTDRQAEDAGHSSCSLDLVFGAVIEEGKGLAEVGYGWLVLGEEEVISDWLCVHVEALQIVIIMGLNQVEVNGQFIRSRKLLNLLELSSLIILLVENAEVDRVVLDVLVEHVVVRLGEVGVYHRHHGYAIDWLDDLLLDQDVLVVLWGSSGLVLFLFWGRSLSIYFGQGILVSLLGQLIVLFLELGEVGFKLSKLFLFLRTISLAFLFIIVVLGIQLIELALFEMLLPGLVVRGGIHHMVVAHLIGNI